MAEQHTTHHFRRPARRSFLILAALCLLILVVTCIQPAFATDSIPTLQFSTFFGGSDHDYGQDIAVDSAGNIYIAGTTDSTDFPTTSSLDGGSNKLFVSKFDPTGTTLLYSIVFGTGSAEGIAVDDDGYAYVVGYGTYLPTVGAIQPAFGGGNGDALIAKINPSGTALVYATYLGGSATDEAFGVALDSARNVYVVGDTGSANFPTQAAYQSLYGGAVDIFIARLNPEGSALVYSTYYGGLGSEVGNDIAADGSGNVYVTGYTSSNDFPVVNPYQPERAGTCVGCGDVFAVKLDASGMPFFSTYLGGSSQDNAFGIAIDSQHAVYITGYTNSADFPTHNAYQPTPPINAPAFITKFSPDGSQLIYSSYLGGTTFNSEGTDIAVDGMGRAAVVGATYATDFPTVKPIQAQRAGTGVIDDPFISVLSPSGRSLEFSTYFGGSGMENFTGRMPHVTFDGDNNLLIVGGTNADDFPILNAFQGQVGGSPAATNAYDAFIAKIAFLPIAHPADAAAARNYYTTDTPTLTWTPITWATQYRVQVSKNKLFTGTPDFEGETVANVFSITTDSLDNGLYYWRVQAQRVNGDWGGWSPVESFIIYAN